MNIGMITTHDREILHRTASAVALLAVPGCPEFSAACQHMAQSLALARSSVEALLAQARRVHLTLAAEAAPDRWLPDLDAMGVPTTQAMDIVADLIDERTTQAYRVAEVRDLCARMLVRLTLVEQEIA